MRSRYGDSGFWIEALDHAVKTMAAAMVAVLGTNTLGVTDVHWLQTLNVGVFAAIVSILTSMAVAEKPKLPPGH